MLHLYSPPSCCCPSLSRERFRKWTRRVETKQHFLQAPPSILSATWQRGTPWGHQCTALHQLTCGGIKGVLQATSFILEGAQFSAVSPNPLGGLQPHRFRFCSSVISHFILRAILYIYLEVFMVIEYGTNLFTQLTSTLLPLSLKKAKFCLLHTKSFKG